MEEENLRAALSELAALDYRPRAPVDLLEFALPAARERWRREKGLAVFSLFSGKHAATEVDLFVQAPFDFDSAYGRALHLEVAPDVVAPFVGMAELVAMKRVSGRPQDLEDVARLTELAGEEGDP
jgi:hypothetical protein